MEVILKQDIDKLGKAGAVVKVKEGFARNYLMPKGLVVPATSQNVKALERESRKKADLAEQSKKNAQQLAEKLSVLSLTMSVLVQEDDKLYGSIGPQEISALLKEEGFEIDKYLIRPDEPIKKLGIYEVPVDLHPEVVAKVKVWVVKK